MAEATDLPSKPNPSPEADDETWFFKDADLLNGSGTDAGASGSRFFVTSMALAVALLAVVAGVYSEAPGLAILLAIIFGPAFLVTFGNATTRRRMVHSTTPHAPGSQGPIGPMTKSEMAATFGKTVAIMAGSVAALAITGILVIVAGIAALFAACALGCNR